MKIIPVMFVITISFSSTTIAAHQVDRHIDLTRRQLFAEKPNASLYWKALLAAAHGNREDALALVAMLHAGETDLATTPEINGSIESFFDRLFLTSIANNPQTLSMLGIFESIGIREHNAYLNDVSPQALLRNLEENKSSLQTLKTFSLADLSQDQKTSYQIFLWSLNHAVTGEKFLFHDYKLQQLFGILSDLIMVFTQFTPLKIDKDVEYYIARLKKIPEQLEQTISLLKYQKEKGIVPPAFALEKVIDIIQNLVPQRITENIFYTHLAEHINSIDMKNKDAFLAQAQQVLQVEVYPAFHALSLYCTQLLNETHTNDGVWALPDGDSYYAYMLEEHTTSSLTADEIHALGLQEVKKVQTEMRAIFAEIGINDPNKNVGELMQELAHDPQFYYPQTEEGRAQCLAQFKAILERCRKELYPLFDLKPAAPVIIQAVPKPQEAGSPSAYYFMPSIDGSRPGTFFVNLRDMKEIPIYGMETLAVHEAEPGHHFQLALQQGMNIPILRKTGLYTAFIEGWALYVEKLAYEQGFYSSPFAQLGHLQDELLRAARLVVDTGIHHKRWSRDEAIDYMTKATGYARESIITEVERYFVYPGQACAYKIGQIKFLELRKRAQDALGAQFDIREFHSVILKLGAAPLPILEEVIDQYIHNKLASF